MEWSISEDERLSKNVESANCENERLSLKIQGEAHSVANVSVSRQRCRLNICSKFYWLN